VQSLPARPASLDPPQPLISQHMLCPPTCAPRCRRAPSTSHPPPCALPARTRALVICLSSHSTMPPVCHACSSEGVCMLTCTAAGAPPSWARHPHRPVPSLHARCVALWGEGYDAAAVRTRRMKLLSQHDDRRPAYYGSWSRVRCARGVCLCAHLVLCVRVSVPSSWLFCSSSLNPRGPAVLHCMPSAAAVLHRMPSAAAVLHCMPSAAAVLHCMPSAAAVLHRMPSAAALTLLGCRPLGFAAARSCLAAVLLAATLAWTTRS